MQGNQSSACFSLPSFIPILREPPETAFSCPEFMFAPHTFFKNVYWPWFSGQWSLCWGPWAQMLNKVEKSPSRETFMTGAGKGGISPDGRACHGILKAAMTFRSPGLGMKGSLFTG